MPGESAASMALHSTCGCHCVISPASAVAATTPHHPDKTHRFWLSLMLLLLPIAARGPVHHTADRTASCTALRDHSAAKQRAKPCTAPLVLH